MTRELIQYLQKQIRTNEDRLGKKDRRQILSSMSRINSEYGIVFSSNSLTIDQDEKIVNVPLDFNFLM